MGCLGDFCLISAETYTNLEMGRSCGLNCCYFPDGHIVGNGLELYEVTVCGSCNCTLHYVLKNVFLFVCTRCRYCH